MRVDQIVIDDFLGHESTSVDLRSIHQAVVTGPVGSGKSSIIDALTWCLYGEARGRTLNQLIREGRDEARVAVTFTIGGDEYRAERAKRRGADSRLLLEHREGPGWRTLTGHTNAESQTALARIIGVEYQPLLAGPWMLQADTGALMRATPAGRKQLLLDLLVGGRWAVWEEEARRRVAQSSTEVQHIDGRLTQLAGAEDRLVKAKALLTTAEADLAASTDREDASRVAAEQARTALAVARERSAEAARLTAEQQEVAAKFVAARSRVEELQRQMVIAREAHGAHVEKRPEGQRPEVGHNTILVEALAAAMNDLRDASVALAALQARTLVRCPECGESVVCPNGHDLTGPPEAEVHEAKMKVAGIQAGIDELQRDERQTRLSEQVWAEWARKATELDGKVLALDAEAEAGKPLVEELASRGRANAQRLSELGGKVDLTVLGDAAAAATRVHDHDKDILTADRELQVRAAALVDRALEQVAEVADLTVQRLDADRKGDIALVLSKAFGRDGVPTLMLESALPLMEARANEVLSRMPGGMRLELRTQRETQKATLRETLDVVVTVNDVERDYELLSGGQRFRVDLALRLGLTQLISQRRISTLLIDEGLDRWQDPEGRAAVLDTLTAVSQDFDRVLVVSHHPDVIERFGTRIEVEMVEGVSRVG